MFSPLTLLAVEFRLFSGLPTIFGIPSELLLPVALAILAMVAGILYGKSIRMEDHGWRIGLIASTFLASLAIILFWEYKLGVDLKGGAILVYEVNELETAANHPQGRSDDWKMADLLQVLGKRLNPDGLKDIVIRPFGPKHVEIVVPEVDEDEVNLLKNKITEAGVLRFLIMADSDTRDRVVRDAAVAQIEDATTQADKLSRNVKDPADATGERIIGVWCEVDRERGSGTVDKDAVRPFTASEAFGSTLLRNGETGEIIQIGRTQADFQELGENPAMYFHRRGIKVVEVLMAADPELDIRGSDLAVASEGIDETGGPCINFVMKADSAWKMQELTSTNKPQGSVTRKLGIVWDNRLVSAPNIMSTIADRGEITGRFTQREVREKVELLRSGSMPVVLYRDPISDDRIGATLGLDTVRKGSQAILISLAIVLGFVLFYYRTAGVIACFALVLNMLMTVALMFALKAPFTLPGLAGLVLTVGMSVDANVLIYERIREELERGAALRMAIRNGFDKALVTIIDSNVTTLLTAVILYVIGTDQVRGFGMTLILGIVTSMFTAVFASRAILEVGERVYRWNTLSMMKFFTHANIDWIGAFKPAAIASIVLIGVGLAATVMRGAGIFDIDLAGGSTVQFILDEQAHPKITEADVREKLEKAAVGVEDPKTKSQARLNVYQKFLADAGQSGDGKEQQIWKVDSSLEDVDQLKELVRKAFRTEDNREGLQTYGLKIGELAEIKPEDAVPPTAPEAPKTETPKAETPAAETPKAVEPKVSAPKGETPKPEGDAPKAETPKAETPKTDTPKADSSKTETPAKDEPKSDSDCQPEESKQETPAEESTKKNEPKADDKKSEDKKTDEPKPEDKKADEPKPEAPKTETPKSEPSNTPPAEPAPAVPPLPEFGPKPLKPASSSIIRSQVHLSLGNTKITGAALQDRLKSAAEKAIGQATIADFKTPGWNGVDNKSFSEWDVTFALPKAEAEKILQRLNEDLSNEPVWQTSSKIGGQVSADTRWRALFAIAGSIVGMIIYMWVRFHKISWGIAAAVALAHDALVMLGAIAVSYWLAGPLGFLQVEEFKISLPVVAAFLTLIGYSINDTIVIFDRIREIRGKSPEINGQMINDAVNQTLSRTILTAGTTLMVIVILYFLGGSGIHAFAFSLVIGVISGSYSTVFIAAPILIYLIGLDSQQAKGKNVPTAAKTTARGAA